MNKTQIRKKVIELIALNACVATRYVQEDYRIVEDLGIDSLGAVELIMEIEKEFSLSVPDDDVYALQHATVKEVIEYLYKRLDV